MKRIFLFSIAMFLILSSCATLGTGAKLTEPLAFNEVVEVSGVLSSELYTKINMWFIGAFKSAESVIQFQDKEIGIIKGKYNSSGLSVGEGATLEYITAYSTITVEIKDERYRITLDEASYRRTGNRFGGPDTYVPRQAIVPVTTEDVANVILPDWKKLSENLKQSIFAKKNDF